MTAQTQVNSSNPVSNPPPPSVEAGGQCYVAQHGETLDSIAANFNTTPDKLLAANPQLQNQHGVYAGDRIDVPASSANTASDVVVAGNNAAKDGATGGIFKGIQEWVDQLGKNLQQGVESLLNGNLGKLSEKYETGGRGPGTVSTGNGDAGGVSYGSYQLASNLNRPKEFLETEGKQWANEFKGLTQGTPAFSKKWKEIAAREPEAFQAAQHNYIKRTHYDPAAANAKSAGLDVSTRSAALRDVVWSTAVQHGPENKIVQSAIKNLESRGIKQDNANYDRELIQAIYAERGRRNGAGELVHFRANSRDVQEGVAQRFKDEQADALKMLDQETKKPATPKPQ